MNNGSALSNRPAGLGARSAQGLVYLFASSSVAKVVSLGAQVALSHLLSEGDYGIVGLAYTVTVLVQVIEQAGVSDVLVKRTSFHLWSIVGFWFSLALGAVSCALVVAIAPLAAYLYNDPRLFWVLLVLALSSIPNSLMAVPRAQLSRELRFGALAGFNLANFAVRTGLTVLFAALGYGPYSFVLPVPITNTASAIFMWWWVRSPWSLRPQFGRWRYFVRDSTQLLAADFCRAVQDQSDNIILGLFRSVSVVGLYSFAFNFSIQIIQLLTMNLTSILFPALTQLHGEPQKQFQGFLKAQRILAMLGISACFLQAAVAQPLSRLVFAAKWEPSIVVMQILSLGMAIRMINSSSYALLKAQGRYRDFMVNRLIFAGGQFAVLAIVILAGGGMFGVAMSVAIIGSAMGPIGLKQAVSPYGGDWATVADVLVRPLVCGVISVGAAWLIAEQMASAGYGNLAQLIEIVFVGVSLNIVLAWLWMRPVWDDLWARVWRLIPNRAAA